jgi:hypothetical protein
MVNFSVSVINYVHAKIFRDEYPYVRCAMQHSTVRNYELCTRIKNIAFVQMRARSEARTVFGRLNTEIVGSKPARGMDVCPLFSVLILSPVRGVLPTV